MGKLTTVSNYKSEEYFRVTIPDFISKQFNLKKGDKFEWELAANNSEILIRVIPRKTVKA
ncbi:MAG: AbrB family transcriptional regulator [Nitrososphaerota archaeon]|jgi:antitoxin component of MazEF toxin-antitoxin module|nr:AbrB family transcriptional regulator [Nitrososphaerota archaeon]